MNKRAVLRTIVTTSGALALAPFFTAAGLQFFPGVASQNASDYLADRDYPVTLSENFNTSNMYVYEPHSVLSALHFAGTAIPDLWQSEHSLDKKITKTLTLPLTMARRMRQYETPYGSTSAFAVSLKNSCFISPPLDDINLKHFLAELSDIQAIKNAPVLNIQSDPEELANVIRIYIMAHEMHHCDQHPSEFAPLMTAPHIAERDADLRALQIIEEAGFNEIAIKEAGKMIEAVRIVSSAGFEKAHDTGLSLVERDTSLIGSYLKSESYDLVGYVAYDIRNTLDFPEAMDQQEKIYHAIKALSFSGYLKTNQDAQNYAGQYLLHFDYLNAISGEILITMPDYHERLDLSYLESRAYQAGHDASPENAMPPSFQY